MQLEQKVVIVTGAARARRGHRRGLRARRRPRGRVDLDERRGGRGQGAAREGGADALALRCE